jgi:hypothetical protein
MKIRIAVAVLLVLIFALITVPTFFVRSFVKTYFNPSFYDGPVLEESHEYFISFFKKQVKKDEFVAKNFSEEDIETLARRYFGFDAFQEIIKDFVSQMNNLSENRQKGELNVSLMPLKQNIPQMASDISVMIIDKIPICESDSEVIETAFEFNGDIPSCIPDEIGKSQVEKPLAREIEKNLNDSIPGEFKLDFEKDITTEETSDFKQLMFIFGYTQMIMPLFMLIVILLMALIIYKPYTRIMKFIGASFVLGGAFALIAGQLFLRVPESVITTANFPEIAAADLNEMSTFYSFLIQFIVDRINIYSIYFFGIGSLIILIGMYLSHFYKHDTQ